jgi:2,3-diketo-5-methylthio-1-phosphopentane phosphatase
LGAELAPHQAACLRLPHSRRLSVFCDFDGTFAIQDVGANLAKKYTAGRRPALWKRYEAGDLTAWEYNMILLDGMEVPKHELHAFLETIELDAGARSLLDWCHKRSVPFRILSDGFDYNLDRLQRLNDVQFEYTANTLRYEGELWRIGATCPNPQCFCGTGACKRGLIESYQRANPEHFCVHIGNGAVSDLCGALAADLAFAKDSLAPALEKRGASYEEFATLHDVVEALERLGWS